VVTRRQIELTLVNAPSLGQGRNVAGLQRVMLMIIDHGRVKWRTRVEIDKSGHRVDVQVSHKPSPDRASALISYGIYSPHLKPIKDISRREFNFFGPEPMISRPLLPRTY